MPTYTCHARSGLLTRDQRADLAERITDLHAETTGAPRFYVQVLYRDLGPGQHFIGGRDADEHSLWVYGLVRAGRSRDVTHRLVTGIRDHVVAVADVPDDAVWVYLDQLDATEMIEFGRVLPAPGEERVWADALPAPLRERLLALNCGPEGPERPRR